MADGKLEYYGIKQGNITSPFTNSGIPQSNQLGSTNSIGQLRYQDKINTPSWSLGADPIYTHNISEGNNLNIGSYQYGQLPTQVSYAPAVAKSSPWIDQFMSQHKKSSLGASYSAIQQALADVQNKRNEERANEMRKGLPGQGTRPPGAGILPGYMTGETEVDTGPSIFDEYIKGASWDAFDAKQAALAKEFDSEEAGWKKATKPATSNPPIKKRELPNEPTVKTLEGSSTLNSLPKEYSPVYGMGPGRRPIASTNLGQGNYRLF